MGKYYKLLIILFLAGWPGLTMAANYPLLANWYYKWDVADSKVEDLAQYDLLIVDMEANYYTPANLRQIKELNPDIKILAYLSPIDIRQDAAELAENNYHRQIGQELAEHPAWILKKGNGQDAEWWPGNYIFDISQTDYQDYLTDFVAANIMSDPAVWDGVFYDNLWEGVEWLDQNIDLTDEQWQASVNKILKKTKRQANRQHPDFIITGNGGVTYADNLNGCGLENFPQTSYGSWTYSLEKYFFIIENAAYSPRYGLINANADNTGENQDYADMRYGLASALLGDGYYSYDDGDETHTQTWWYDEYSVALGEAVNSPYNILNSEHPNKVQTGLWRRDFANGLVLVNSTDQDRRLNLETGYEKINGEQDPETNNGIITATVTIPAKDGLILLGRLAEIINVPYVNGGYAKVFDSQGEMLRNSFFSYNNDFAGGVQIVKLPDQNKIIVADQTYISIYKNNVLQVKFAPYGTDFKGGVNIAVGQLYKKDRRYYIVTGTQKYGPQVRIYNLKGNLKNPGAFPYAESFQGGVNVAIGDLNGDDRAEIIVAAGYGGGPHIRVLNNKLELINPGFFAYDPAARFGVNIGVGDLNNDGKAEIVTGPGPGGAPHIRIFNRQGQLLSPGFYAYDKSDTSGVLVGVTDIDQNGTLEIVTSSFGIFSF